MARHAVRAGRPEPKAVIKAAPSEYERTHPVGSAERFLDQAAREALALAAAGGIPPPSKFIPGAVRAVAKEAEKYPDPLLAEAAGLPAKELARRAANAEAYRKAIDAQNAVVDTVSLGTSPAGNMAANLLGANTHDALTRQDWDGGDSERKEAIRPDRYPSLFFTGEDFDSDALVKDAAKAGKSPREILRLFYGDQTDRILAEAAAARGNRYREAVGQMVTVGRPETDNFDTDVQNPGRYDLPYNVEDKDETEDPMQRWFRKMVDSFAGPTQSRAYSREGKAAIWGGRGWAHEITGHLMNPVQNTKADIDLREQQNSLGNSTRYYISNNSELAAALGNLRKQMFKRTGGKVDIKDPDMLRAVFRDYARNPRMYNGRWLSHDARALLRSWTDVPSNAQIDQEWDKRWRKVHLDMLRDPQFTNKVVANNTVDHQSHADAKGGDARAVRAADGAGVNTVSRVEFENTTEREKARRKAITDVEREAARPRIGGVSRIQQAAMAEADEALRLSTGIGRKGWLAIPKKEWDKLGQLEKERLAKTVQDAMETGMAYAVPGMMTYGSAAARLGNQPLMKTMLARKPWAEMTREERLALKRATRYELGAQGMGVETLDDIRYIDGAKIPKRRYRGQHRIPDRAGTPVLDAFKIPDDLRSDPELLNMLRSTRVSLDDMGAKAYGLTRKSHVDLNTRLFSDLTDLRDSTIAHEFDHVLHLDKSPAAPVASLNTSKMPGVYGERAATIDKDVHGWLNADYVFSPREVDARTTGARTALSPAERMATLREDIALRDPMTAEYVGHAKKRKLEWENSPVAKSFRQKMKAVGFDENTRGMENPLSLWELDNEGLRTEIRFLDPKARPIVQDLLQERLSQQDAKGGRTVRAAEGGGNNTVSRVEFANTTEREKARLGSARPAIGAHDPRFRPLDEQRASLPELLASKLPSGASRDLARMALHGLARTGNTILKAIDIPNRVFGNTRSLLQDIYERSEANLARDAYEDQGGVPQVGETAVHLASAGVLGKALPAVFGANVGADTYEMAKHAGASEGEALAKGIGHGAVDTAIWTLGQGLASKYLPKAWQWLGREIIGAGRGAASSVTSDAVLNSLGADISGEEMAKRAVHAAWMVPLLGMLKMGKGSRERALAELKKVRPDLAGERVDKVIETLESEFSDPRSQKVALAWVARKGANLPDDLAQIHQAIEVANKVKGVDFTQKSPFEIISDPRYARYLPKPRPQDVKAFSNMKRYPMGVIGFDVSDDAAGRQATREMINAYMSPSSNPWCLATGKDAAKLGELGPGAKGYWKQHSAVPKQIFFQEVDGKLELTAFRATAPGGEGRQEYWDTSDAGYSGIPIKVKVPGDPMGRYRKMVFRPAGRSSEAEPELSPEQRTRMEAQVREGREQLARIRRDGLTPLELEDLSAAGEPEGAYIDGLQAQLELWERALSRRQFTSGEVQGTFEDIAPGKVFKGDPFRDGRSQTWVRVPENPIPEGGLGSPFVIGAGAGSSARTVEDAIAHRDRLIRLRDNAPADERDGWDREIDRVDRAIKEYQRPTRSQDSYILVEDKIRTTENGITRFRTTKYADPTEEWDYEPPKPGEAPKPVEIEESELVSPEWMRSRGYDPESEAGVRRMQSDLNIQAWGNGVEAAMAVVPTKRTYMQTKSGTPETVTYGPNGRDIVSVDFVKDGVSYRETFAPVPENARQDFNFSDLYQGERDYNDLPRPGHGYGSYYPILRRLVRNPGSASEELLEDIGWNEELGSFVRTSGSRRWRFEHEGDPEPLFRSVIEDRQPDGTWALVETSNIQASPSRANALPPPPDEIPMWAQMGLDEEGLRAELEYEEAMERDYEESMERAAPDMQVQQGLDMDDDVPFALKAGRTRRNVRAAEGGGDAGSETAVSETPVSEAPVQQGGPRIVINPTTFHNKKDALCVAFNEGFRVWMEANGFEPQSEPTDAQRKFFSDTAYADDEVQLRRTILARIATFDTSVKDPTDDQLAETASFLGAVLESGWCRNDWERDSVSRLMNAVQSAVGAEPVEPRQEPLEAREAEPLQRHAAMGGGETEDEEKPQPATDPAAPADTPTPTETPKADVPAPDGADQAPKDLGKFDETDGEHAQALKDAGHDPAAVMGQASAPAEQAPSKEAPGQAPNDGRPHGGIDRSQLGQDGHIGGGVDRSQFGQNGRIGIGERIVDPETGKSRSSLSMNGPAIRPARAIGDMGSTSLTDTKSVNGPAIEPTTAIGDMGSTSLTDTKSANGPAIRPGRRIGDLGRKSLVSSRNRR